jgi:SAM-dependent methyltransferase
MSCRVCASERTRAAGSVEYFHGHPYEVVDCDDCGCRATAHDPAAHEALHRFGALDHYAGYREIGAAARQLFAARDREGLRRLLEPEPKYRFAMDAIDRLPHGMRVLEVGCSRGYLTAYALLAGHPALGVDVSREALESAREAFGDAFLPAGSPEIAGRGPYDLVFHVGLIGCVADPMGLTRELLGLLGRGGRLAFNAPNRDALAEGELWLDSAPPPDLVTLFPEGFWVKRFGTVAQVHESVERRGPRASFEMALREMWGEAWAAPQPRALEAPAPRVAAKEASRGLRAISRLAQATGIARLARAWPTPFGLFVTMRPRSGRLG